MALTEQTSGRQKTSNAEFAVQSAPLWLTLMFFGGFVLLYLSQRVLVDTGTLATILSSVGLLILLASTALRFAPQFAGKGPHVQIARLLSLLQLVGCLGAGLYYLQAETGMSSDSTELSAIVAVAWVLCVLVSVVPLVFVEIALHPMRSAAQLESARVRLAAVNGIMLALAAGYGSLLVYAAAQTESQADFSYFKTSEPGEATIKLVQQMAEPVKVTAFFPQVSDARKEVSSYLKQLKAEAGNIEVELVDRYLQPAIAKKLKVVQDGTLVLAKGEATKNLFIGTELKKARAKLKKLDGDFNSQLLKLLKSRRVAYLTTGHGELNDPERGAKREEGRSAKILKKILEHQNFRVKDLSLSTGLGNEVPEDAAVVLVLGPSMPFSPAETGTLKRYAERGGKVLMALDIDGVSARAGYVSADEVDLNTSDKPAPTKPKGVQAQDNGSENERGERARQFAWVKELAATVGANYEPVLLADTRRHVRARFNASDRTILPTNRFSSHASVSTLSRNSARANVVVAGAGYLEINEKQGAKGDVAVRTFSSVFRDHNGNFEQEPPEKAASHNLALALWREPAKGAEKPAQEAAPKLDDGHGHAAGEGHTHGQKAESDIKEKKDGKADTVPAEMRAFVLSDADALSDLLMRNVPGNQMLLVDALRWLAGEESLAGEINEEQDVRIEHTKQKDQLWFYSTIFGVPALVLVGGLWISRRARGKGRA